MWACSSTVSSYPGGNRAASISVATDGTSLTFSHSGALCYSEAVYATVGVNGIYSLYSQNSQGVTYSKYVGPYVPYQYVYITLNSNGWTTTGFSTASPANSSSGAGNFN